MLKQRATSSAAHGDEDYQVTGDSSAVRGYMTQGASLPFASNIAPSSTNLVSSAALAPGAVFASPVGTDSGAVPLSLVEASSIATNAMKTGDLSHFDMHLAALYYANSAESTAMSAFVQSVEQFSGALSSDGQYVLVDTTAANRDGAALLAQLQTMGLKGGSSFGAVASGWMPISSLGQLATTANLASARESAFTTHTGSVTTQADHAQMADTARATYGVSGSGIRVGVLSDSFNGNGSTTDNQFTNITTDDLPVDTRVLHDTSGEDEGRAMAQLIHDLAPGAAIDFATAFNGEAAFANYIVQLAASGDKIIVDDVSYYDELSYQNGIIGQAVNQVAAQGVSYFSSAGNDGLEGYEGAWVAGAQQTLNGQAYTLMNFAPGQDYINVTLSSSRQVFILQWDNPAASAGGVGATSDLDLFLVNANGTTIRGSSVTNNVGGDPVEVFSFTGTGSQSTVGPMQLRVGLRNGTPAPTDVRLIASGNGASVDLANPASNTNLSTLTGHHGATGAMATAAVSFARTPVAGYNPPVAESYTSRGGQKIVFDDTGNRLSGPIYTNIAFTAVDGGNTTFFTSDSSQDTDTLPNFFGTSAAAPDAAAVGALLLQANPDLTPTDIRALLQDSAIDMDDSATTGFDTGYDSRTGTGLIQADRAVNFVLNHVISNSGLNQLVGTHFGETINGSASADSINAMDGNDTVIGGAGADTIYGGAGDDYITGNQDNDKLFGESGNDQLFGGQGDDILDGGIGDDTLEGGLGNDIIRGGTGNNTVSYTFASGGVNVTLGDIGSATGAAGNDTLYSIQNVTGSAFADVITGSAEDNVLIGDQGSDELHGSDGNDTLDGGAGTETQYAETVHEPDIIKPQTQANTSIANALVLTNANFDLDFNYEIENSRTLPHATVLATAAGSGFEYYAVTATAGSTAVFDIDHSGIDTVIDLLNSAGNVIATNDDDYADPGSEQYNSRIAYTFSADGTYYLRVKDFNSSTTLHAGDTYTLNVSLSSAAVTYTGNTIDGFDVLDGGSGIDTASYRFATTGVNVSLLLHDQVQQTGGGGPDYLISIENLTGSDHNDVLVGDEGANTLTGLNGDDSLTGNGGNDMLVGNQGNDVLTGGTGDDMLYGGQGTDILNGGADNDTLIGGAGSDTLTGGTGADIFKYLSASDSVQGSADLITDFQSGTDKLDLTAVHTNASDTYMISSSGGITTVTVDLLGNGTTDMVITANGTNAITTGDILWASTSGGSTVASTTASTDSSNAADTDSVTAAHVEHAQHMPLHIAADYFVHLA